MSVKNGIVRLAAAAFVFVLVLTLMSVPSDVFTSYTARPNETVRALRMYRQPVIDGVISAYEWGEPTVFSDSGQSVSYAVEKNELERRRLSMEIWLRWDPGALYVAVRTPELDHSLKYTGGDLWNGDSLQIGIDPDGANSTRDPRHCFGEDSSCLGFGLYNARTPAAKTFSRWYSPNGASDDAGQISYAVSHADKTTVYEIKIPFSELFLMADEPEKNVSYPWFLPGDSVGITILRRSSGSADSTHTGFLSWGSGLAPQPADYISGSNKLVFDTTPAYEWEGVEAEVAAADAAAVGEGNIPAAATGDSGIVAAGISVLSAASSSAICRYANRKRYKHLSH